MFREIRTAERITEADERRRREREGFRKIKPETQITTEECNRFIDEMFRIAHEEAMAASQGK